MKQLRVLNTRNYKEHKSYFRQDLDGRLQVCMCGRLITTYTYLTISLELMHKIIEHYVMFVLRLYKYPYYGGEYSEEGQDLVFIIIAQH